jgi:hypothetical protein
MDHGSCDDSLAEAFDADDDREERIKRALFATPATAS